MKNSIKIIQILIISLAIISCNNNNSKNIIDGKGLCEAYLNYKTEKNNYFSNWTFKKDDKFENARKKNLKKIENHYYIELDNIIKNIEVYNNYIDENLKKFLNRWQLRIKIKKDEKHDPKLLYSKRNENTDVLIEYLKDLKKMCKNTEFKEINKHCIIFNEKDIDNILGSHIVNMIQKLEDAIHKNKIIEKEDTKYFKESQTKHITIENLKYTIENSDKLSTLTKKILKNSLNDISKKKGDKDLFSLKIPKNRKFNLYKSFNYFKRSYLLKQRKENKNNNILKQLKKQIKNNKFKNFTCFKEKIQTIIDNKDIYQISYPFLNIDKEIKKLNDYFITKRLQRIEKDLNERYEGQYYYNEKDKLKLLNEIKSIKKFLNSGNIEKKEVLKNKLKEVINANKKLYLDEMISIADLYLKFKISEDSTNNKTINNSTTGCETIYKKHKNLKDFRKSLNKIESLYKPYFDKNLNLLSNNQNDLEGFIDEAKQKISKFSYNLDKKEIYYLNHQINNLSKKIIKCLNKKIDLNKIRNIKKQFQKIKQRYEVILNENSIKNNAAKIKKLNFDTIENYINNLEENYFYDISNDLRYLLYFISGKINKFYINSYDNTEIDNAFNKQENGISILLNQFNKKKFSLYNFKKSQKRKIQEIEKFYNKNKNNNFFMIKYFNKENSKSLKNDLYILLKKQNKKWFILEYKNDKEIKTEIKEEEIINLFTKSDQIIALIKKKNKQNKKINKRNSKISQKNFK